MDGAPRLTRSVKRRMVAGLLAVPPAIGLAVCVGCLALHWLALLPYLASDPAGAAARLVSDWRSGSWHLA